MKSQFIKSKKVIGGFLSIVEFTDVNGEPINYSIIKIYLEDGVLGGGATKIEDIFSSDDKEAVITFLNEYN